MTAAQNLKFPRVLKIPNYNKNWFYKKEKMFSEKKTRVQKNLELIVLRIFASEK